LRTNILFRCGEMWITIIRR